MHNQEFSVDVVNTYRAWDELSRREDDDNYHVIDIDVAPRYVNQLRFNTSEQVTWALEELLDRAPYSGDYADFTAAKLSASLLYLRLLAGDKVTLGDHTRTAMGVTLEKVEENLIADYRERMDATLTEHGLRFEREHEAALVISEGKQKLVRRLLGVDRQTGDYTAEFTGADGGLAIEPTIVEEDAEWVGWFGTDDQGEVFEKINVHPRHKHTIARLAAIVIHEVQGHGAQFSIWRDKIRRGEMDPVMGINTMHTPECTQAEFNAQTIEQIGLRALVATDPENGWQYGFQADYHDYSEMVWHNAHIMINSGYAEEKVVEYAADRLPFTKLENIEKSIPERRDNPMIRGYFACYEPAMAAGRLLLARPVQKQKAVLRETFSRPMTLAQIETLVTS